MACVEQKAAEPNKNIYDGTDVKAEFLKQYSGSYKLPADPNIYLGVDAASATLNIQENGTYTLVVRDYSVHNVGDNRSAICSSIESGDLIYAQRTNSQSLSLRVGLLDYRLSEPVDGYLVLQPKDFRLTKSATVKHTDAEENINVDKENPFSSAEFERLCNGRKGSERVLAIEKFLKDSFLVARNSSSDRLKSTYTIQGRVAAKDGVEWVWFEKDLAKKAIAEAATFTQRRIKGLEVENQALSGSEDKRPFTLAMTSEVYDPLRERVRFTFHVRLVGDKLVPLVGVGGKLMGVSYHFSSAHMVAHLTSLEVSSLPTLVGEDKSNDDLNKEVEEKINLARTEIKKLLEGVARQDDEKTIYTVGIDPVGAGTVKIGTRAKNAPR